MELDVVVEEEVVYMGGEFTWAIIGVVELNVLVLNTERDSWGWRPEGGGVFLVKSTYDLL